MKQLLLAALLACASVANAQLPNEKFGKPSSQEWEFSGWGDGFDADAVTAAATSIVVIKNFFILLFLQSILTKVSHPLKVV